MYSAYTLCLLVSVLAAVVSSFEIQGESSSSPKAGGGVYGVDVSSVVSTSSFQCLAGAGITSIVMRAYRSSGSVDTNACTTLNNAKAGGIPHRDAYLFPCPTCGTSAQKQISDMVNYLTGTCPSAWSGRLWLDIEGSSYWTGSYSSNKAFYQGLIDYCRSAGLKCGVYASQSQWNAIFGSSSYVYGNEYPLWYAHYDNVASFDDYYAKYSFGGWKDPYAKQYAGTTTVCDASIDKDYALTWA